MKHKVSIILLIAIAAIAIYGQPSPFENKSYVYDGASRFKFERGLFSILLGDSETVPPEIVSPYSVSLAGGYYFVDSKAFSFFAFPFEKYAELYVVKNNRGTLAKAMMLDGYEIQKDASAWSLLPVSVESASSHLVEQTKKGTISYIPSGVIPAFHFYNPPWVVSNKGIGQFIVFSIDRKKLGLTSTVPKNKLKRLIISNGFFYPDNPGSFSLNSRIKRARIEVAGHSFDVTLKDSPQLQAVDLPIELDLTIRQEFKLIIEDVYVGSKYLDVALSAILYEVCSR